MNAILTIVLALMTALSPPGRNLWIPEAKETLEEGTARYEEIAKAAYDVAYDEEESPILGSRDYTLAMLMAIAYHESAFRKDVDTGEGRKRLSALGHNDSGRSWCLGQVMLGKKGDDSAATTAEGWTGKELLADRRKCFRAVLHIIKRTQCGRGPGMLSAYASGSCEKGLDKSRIRMLTAQKIFERLRSFRLTEKNQ